MSEKEIDKHYRIRAKEITNMLFDKGFLADDLTRESIDRLEDFLGYILQSNAEMAENCALLLKSWQQVCVPNGHA